MQALSFGLYDYEGLQWLGEVDQLPCYDRRTAAQAATLLNNHFQFNGRIQPRCFDPFDPLVPEEILPEGYSQESVDERVTQELAEDGLL
jgi:hypothetical protein